MSEAAIAPIGAGFLLTASVACSSGGGGGILSPEGGGPVVAPHSADHATYENVIQQPSQPDMVNRIAFASGRMAAAAEMQLESGRQARIECSDYEWLDAKTVRVTARMLKVVQGGITQTVVAAGDTHDWTPEFGSDGNKLYATVPQRGSTLYEYVRVTSPTPESVLADCDSN
jgi:hypothetical protein